jgi:hypothetical protein
MGLENKNIKNCFDKICGYKIFLNNAPFPKTEVLGKALITPDISANEESRSKIEASLLAGIFVG